MALQKKDTVAAALLFSLIGVSIESGYEPVKSPSTTCGSSDPSGWSVTYSTCFICALRGSSVRLNSTYRSPSNEPLQGKMWHLRWPAGGQEPHDVTDEPSYQGRVGHDGGMHRSSLVDSKTDGGLLKSTLTIRELKDSDEREYFFRIRTHSNKFSGAPGIRVSVTGLLVKTYPDSVTEGDFAYLTCSTECSLSDNPTFVWYKNGRPMDRTHTHNTVYHSIHLTSVTTHDAGHYSCAVRGNGRLTSPSLFMDVKYPPKNTSADVYPPGEVTEGSSLTLVCSSSANPPAHSYSWFRRTRTGAMQIDSAGQNYSIPSVSWDHSGQYFCRAGNTVGQANSSAFTLNVTYAPRSPKTVVSPSGDLVEGGSMTLACSGEANPPVHTYAWYKRSGAHSSKLAVGRNYSVPNVTYGHSGEYYCQAENAKGSTHSTPVFVDVLYPPRNISVLVSSFDGAVTLTCSGDANPAVEDYTWHKRTGTDSSPRGTGRNLTLDSGESGLYYCRAQNALGAALSDSLPISENNTVGKYVSAATVAFGALIVIVSISLRIRKNRMSAPGRTGRTGDSEQDGSASPVYVNVSRVAVTSDPQSSADPESNVHYSSVCFKQWDQQEVSPLYSTLAKPQRPLVENEVLYSPVLSHH